MVTLSVRLSLAMIRCIARREADVQAVTVAASTAWATQQLTAELAVASFFYLDFVTLFLVRRTGSSHRQDIFLDGNSIEPGSATGRSRATLNSLPRR